MAQPVVIATWPFGQTAVKIALPLLEEGKPALDAAIAGAQAVEDDPKVMSVGYGGVPNAVGTVQLDACVMDGQTLACGAVAGLENVKHPAALARRVMEKTPHVLLVGEGARWFAMEQGFPLEDLHTPESLAQWYRTRPKNSKFQGPAAGVEKGVWNSEEKFQTPFSTPAATPENHDTVTVLALDKKGNLGGVCTTSGLA